MWSRGGGPGLPVPNIPYGLWTSWAPLSLPNSPYGLCARLGLPVPNSPYGLCARLRLPVPNSPYGLCARLGLPVPNSPYSLCGRLGLPVPNSPYSLCGRPGLPVPNSPYGLCRRKAIFNRTIIIKLLLLLGIFQLCYWNVCDCNRPAVLVLFTQRRNNCKYLYSSSCGFQMINDFEKLQ